MATLLEQPEALRVANALEVFNVQLFCLESEREVIKASIDMIRRLHARDMQADALIRDLLSVIERLERFAELLVGRVRELEASHKEPQQSQTDHLRDAAKMMDDAAQGLDAQVQDRLERYATRAVAAEREACAQIVDKNAALCVTNREMHDVLHASAVAIRARGAAS